MLLQCVPYQPRAVARKRARVNGKGSSFMSTATLSAHFLRIEVFQGLSPAIIAEIARRAERVVYRPGQHLIEDGQLGDAAVLVVDGQVNRIQPDGEQPVETGSLLGEMAMLVETQHTSTVVAETSVRALRIPRTQMLEILAEDPQVADHFIQKVVQRLKRVADSLRQVDSMLASAATPPETALSNANADL